MSGNLAIAAVSAVMKYLLLNPPADSSIAAVAPDLSISVLPPHRITGDTPTLNLFFYRAVSNPGWSNLGLPARNSQGERQSNPYLPLDLYYLISAHSQRDYRGEILLGFAMQTFHENAILTRETIRAALNSASLVTGDTPPSLLQAFAASGVAEQIEAVKITPHYPTPEETANIWSVMNSEYAPSAFYKVSALLIESKRPARAALPVRAYNIYAQAFRQPVIQDVIAEDGPGVPIFAGGRVLLRGSALRGDHTVVTVGGVEVSGAALSVGNEQIAFDLPNTLQSGIVGAQVAHLLNIGDPAALHPGFESNTAAFILQPQITQTGGVYDIQVLPPAGPLPRRLNITLNPAVGAQQRATLLLNERNAPSGRAAHSFSFPAVERALNSPAAVQLTFLIPGVPDGEYLARVRIDGAESPLDYVHPGGFVSPAVNLA